MKWTVQSSIWLLYLIPASLHWTDKDVFPFVWLTNHWELWPDRVSEWPGQTPVQFVEGTNMSIVHNQSITSNTNSETLDRLQTGSSRSQSFINFVWVCPQHRGGLLAVSTDQWKETFIIKRYFLQSGRFFPCGMNGIYFREDFWKYIFFSYIHSILNIETVRFF